MITGFINGGSDFIFVNEMIKHGFKKMRTFIAKFNSIIFMNFNKAHFVQCIGHLPARFDWNLMNFCKMLNVITRCQANVEVDKIGILRKQFVQSQGIFDWWATYAQDAKSTDASDFLCQKLIQIFTDRSKGSQPEIFM